MTARFWYSVRGHLWSIGWITICANRMDSMVEYESRNYELVWFHHSSTTTHSQCASRNGEFTIHFESIQVLPNLMVLLYADDLVQCADLPGRLQSQLNVLADFCEKWGMQVNFDKTNVMVFRSGGIIKRNELWYFKGQQLRPATYYKWEWLFAEQGWTNQSAWF